MKVRITVATEYNWYKDEIGKKYEVDSKLRYGCYILKNSIFGIEKNHCEIIKNKEFNIPYTVYWQGCDYTLICVKNDFLQYNTFIRAEYENDYGGFIHLTKRDIEHYLNNGKILKEN